MSLDSLSSRGAAGTSLQTAPQNLLSRSQIPGCSQAAGSVPTAHIKPSPALSLLST